MLTPTSVTSLDISQNHPYIKNPDAFKTYTKESSPNEIISQKVEVTQVHKEVLKMYEQTYQISLPKESSDENEHSTKETSSNKIEKKSNTQEVDSDDEETF